MYFENHLTVADMERAKQTSDPPPPLVLASTFAAGLEAIDIFSQEYVVPTTTAKQSADREKVFVALYYRSIGFCRTAGLLKATLHQQSLTSAERSVMEMYVDMELLHRNVVADGVARAIALIDVQKLRSARRVDRFFTEHPQLDQSEAGTHRAYIQNNTSAIEARAAQLWGKTQSGKPILPDHWTNMNLPERAKLLDINFELLVLHGYDMRNFAVHTGLAGVMGFSAHTFQVLCAQSLQNIRDCLLGELRIIGQELDMENDVPHYWKLLAELEEVETPAFCDAALRGLGEPQRFFILRGDPPSA